jgi:hypothetical protein
MSPLQLSPVETISKKSCASKQGSRANWGIQGTILAFAYVPGNCHIMYVRPYYYYHVRILLFVCEKIWWNDSEATTFALLY